MPGLCGDAFAWIEKARNLDRVHEGNSLREFIGEILSKIHAARRQPND